MSSCSFVAGIEPRVIKQIKVREEKFGKSPKTDKELMIIHGNCPWVVLRSGVDAPVHDPDRWEVFPRTEPKSCLVTNDWAKKTVLGGEMQDRSKENIVRPRGIQTQPGKGINPPETLLDSAYRITDYQGHRPVAGITEFTVTSRDTWGMVFEVNIKIKCWSRDELDMLDRVYFKPGYSALLEWGHTLYFREDGTECITPSQMISDEEFFAGGDYRDLDAKVIRKRKEDSNREAMFGNITNFSFSLNKDGSYDCSLKMLTKGSVIRGLRIKGTALNQDPNPSEKESEDKQLYEDISVWHRMHQAFIEMDADPEKREKNIESIDYPVQAGDYDVRNFPFLPPRRSGGTGKGEKYFNGLEALEKGDSQETVGGLFKKITVKKAKLFNSEALKGLPSFPVIAVPLKVKKNKSTGKANSEYYITLRTLLLLVNHFNSEDRFKFNLWDTSVYADPEGTTEIPAVSLSPYIAVKPRQSIEYGKDYSIEKGTNFYNLILETDPKWNETEAHRILNIWINFDQFLLEIEHQLAAKVEDYSIMEALQSYLGRVQKAFGNVNEFQIVADHKNGDNLFAVIDAKDIRIEKEDEIREIQVTGLNNTISDLKVTSEISSDIANQMSIAAQAPRTYQDGSENADEPMIHWGENCENRWWLPDESKSTNSASTSDSKKEDYEKIKEKWVKKLKKAYNSIRNGSIDSKADKSSDQTLESKNSEAVLAAGEERFQDLQLQGETYMHELVATEAATREGPNLQMGIIPIRVGLTMMGIGNLTVGNVFRLKSGVMPEKYRSWAQIITGIEHRVTKAGWVTVLKTQYYPINYSKSGKPSVKSTGMAQALESSVQANISSGASTNYVGGRTTRDPEALEKTCNMYDAMTKYAGYTWGKSQGHCARYTAAWARAYTQGKRTITEPDTKTWTGYSVPATPAGGNACDAGYRANLRSMGYTEQSVQEGMSPAKITEYAKNCSEGDVLIYYPVDSKGEPTYYGHTQFNTGHGWVSDFPQASEWSNSGSKGNKNPSNYRMIHLKAPRRSSDWCEV